MHYVYFRWLQDVFQLFFLSFSKKISNKKIALIALLLFVFAAPLIYYSNEVKQYIVDVLTTVVSLYIFLPLKDNYSKQDVLKYSLWGIIIVWFSQPVVFVLFSIGVGILLKINFRKKYNQLYPIIVILLLWLISFAIQFKLLLKADKI
jgi:hypothetical protein